MKDLIDRILDTRLKDYVNMDKIDHLYRQTVDRIEEKLIVTSQRDKKKTLSSKISLGRILNFLGLDLALQGNLETENSSSEQLISQLGPEQKLKIVILALVKERSIFHLNEILRTRGSLPPNSVVVFDCSARFELPESTDGFPDSDLVILARGHSWDFELLFNCSKKYFVGAGSSLELDIREQVERILTGFASVKKIDHAKQKIYLNPIYF